MTARFAPAAERNRQPILEALAPRLPPTGRLLEIASGTGQHAAWLARHLTGWIIQPSDLDPSTPASVAAWAETEGVADRVRPTLTFSAAAPTWPIAACDAVFCANLIHIAPWSVAEGLFAGVARLGVPLFLYGPFRFFGDIVESNLTFEAWLHRQDPAYGVRDVADLEALAGPLGYTRTETLALPANNHLLVWRR